MHTQGPWRAMGHIILSSRGQPLGRADHSNGDTFYDAESNAALMAAAPELLESLQAMLVASEPPFPGVAIDNDARFNNLLSAARHARSAIAKATQVAGIPTSGLVQ